MEKVVLWVQTVLLPLLGPFGVFVIAFCDSSFLSIPEVNDFLVVTAAAGDSRRAWITVAMTTAGSLAGSLVLWQIGRRGGEPLLVRRFGAAALERTRRSFRRWDVLALAIPALLPPPMPFKIFVLSSGVYGLPFRRVATTLLVARSLRYSFWATMGALHGEAALATLRAVDDWSEAHLPLVAGLLAVAGLGALLGYLVVRRRRGRAMIEDRVEVR